jgi:hypothetical protein
MPYLRNVGNNPTLTREDIIAFSRREAFNQSINHKIKLQNFINMLLEYETETSRSRILLLELIVAFRLFIEPDVSQELATGHVTG